MNTPKIIAVGTSVTVVADARHRTNPTNVTLLEGHHYRVSCASDAQWHDGKITCDADGWTSKQSPPALRWLVKQAERWRVLPNANWFTLIGLYANHPEQPFALGMRCDFVARYTDSLRLAANDIPMMYWNNHGELTVHIEHLRPELS